MSFGGGWQALLSQILGRQPGDTPVGATPPFIGTSIPGLSSGTASIPVSGQESDEGGGAWSENIPGGGGTSAAPNLPSAAAGGVRTGNPTLDAILRTPTPSPKLRPLDYLVMAASPAVSGLVGALSSPEKDRRLGFWTGMLGGGVNQLANLAARPHQQAEARRNQMIQEILLQNQVRGARPVQTEEGWRWPGTGELIPGGLPPQKAGAAAVHTREVEDEQGNKHVEQYDEATKTWVPAMTEQTDASGQKVRVPLISKPKAEKAPRELRVGKDEQYYWVEPGKDPVPTKVFRPASDRPEHESDVRRAEKQSINTQAMRYIGNSQKNLGAKATPEEIANDALKNLRADAQDQNRPNLKGYSEEISASIRNIMRPVRSQDELTALVTAMMGGGTQQKPQ